jgi:hypothetical protein
MIKPFTYSSAPFRITLILGVSLVLAAGAILHLLWGSFVRGRSPARGGDHIQSVPVSAPALPFPAVFLKAENETPQAVSNLFHSAYVDRALLKLAEQKAMQEAALKAAKDKAAQAAVNPVSTKPPLKVLPAEIPVTKPVPPPVRFRFQGVIRTADDQVLALISDSPSGRSAPFAEGETCHGAMVTNLTADRVDLILNNGSIRGVSRGIPEAIAKELLYAP